MLEAVRPSGGPQQNAGLWRPEGPARAPVGTLAGGLRGCAVSSGVEHFLDTEGVRGSNPLSRTIFEPARAAALARSAGTYATISMSAESVDERHAAIQDMRERINQIAAQITALHPCVPRLAEPATQAEVLRALFELTKQVEVVKKHLLKLEKRDDAALL